MITQPKPPRIVVAIDGSEQSKLALRWGAKIAADMGVGLDAIAAWHYPVVYGWAAPAFDPHSNTEKLLAMTVVHALGPDRARDVRLLIREGNPAHVLIEQSRFALMLVIGDFGHGSVSTAVSEHALCPVMVVHGDRDPLDAAAAVATRPVTENAHSG
jgi:nucleotide-binding universal stress UspA family protein